MLINFIILLFILYLIEITLNTKLHLTKIINSNPIWVKFHYVNKKKIKITKLINYILLKKKYIRKNFFSKKNFFIQHSNFI